MGKMRGLMAAAKVRLGYRAGSSFRATEAITITITITSAGRTGA
jgi:hypothetical protein